jgi:hypothetical protein
MLIVHCKLRELSIPGTGRSPLMVLCNDMDIPSYYIPSCLILCIHILSIAQCLFLVATPLRMTMVPRTELHSFPRASQSCLLPVIIFADLLSRWFKTYRPSNSISCNGCSISISIFCIPRSIPTRSTFRMASAKLQELMSSGKQSAEDAINSLANQVSSLSAKVTTEAESEAHQVRFSAVSSCCAPRHTQLTSICNLTRSSEVMRGIR